MANKKSEDRVLLDEFGVEYVERVLYWSTTIPNAAKFLGVRVVTLNTYRKQFKKQFNALQAEREQGLRFDEPPENLDSVEAQDKLEKQKKRLEVKDEPLDPTEALKRELENLEETSQTAIKVLERRLEKRQDELDKKNLSLITAREQIDKLKKDKKDLNKTIRDLTGDVGQNSALEKENARLQKSNVKLVEEVKGLKEDLRVERMNITQLKNQKAEAERKAENALKLKDVALQDEIKRLKDKIEGQQVTINSAAKATQAMREAHAKQIAEQEEIHIEDITNYEKDFKALEAEKLKLEERVTELLNRPMEMIDARTLPQEQQDEMIKGFRHNSEELEFWRDTAKLYQKQLRELGGL